jgi:acyl dehydratase
MTHSMKIKYFEDFVVGAEEHFDGEYLMTKEEIIEVAGRWDPQPFHLDEAAAADSVFGGLVAASAHIFAISSWMATRLPYRTAAIAALGFDEIRLPNPARVGDRLSAVSKCVGARESKSKPDRGIIQSEMLLKNQNGETVMSIKSTFIVAKRPDGE